MVNPVLTTADCEGRGLGIDRGWEKGRRSMLRFIHVATIFSVTGGLLLACGSSGGGGGGAGGSTDTGCKTDAECKGTRVCLKGACVEPNAGGGGATAGASGAGGTTGTGGSGNAGSGVVLAGSGGMGGMVEGSAGSTGAGGSVAPACTANGQTCAKNGDCCSFSKGGLCVDFGSGHVCADGCTASSGCQSGCCAALASGGGACGPVSACSTTGQGIGDGCTSNTQCKRGNCSSTTAGWCTKSCAYSIPDCNGDYAMSTFMWNKYGNPNWCLTNAAGTNSCFPGCITSTQCTPYPGTTCKAATTTAGTAVSACAR